NRRPFGQRRSAAHRPGGARLQEARGTRAGALRSVGRPAASPAGTAEPGGLRRCRDPGSDFEALRPVYGRRKSRCHPAPRIASCHVLFGEGVAIGPELTGSQRHNLDYVLEDLLDPSAVVGRDHQVSIVQTRDGRLVTGIVKQDTDRALTLQTQNETVVVPKAE